MLNFRLVEVVIWRTSKIHLGSNKNSCQTHGLVIFLLHCNANSLMLEILKWQNLGTICISVPHSKFCRTRTPTPRESWCMPMTFPPKTTSIRLATMHQRYTETDTRTHTHRHTQTDTHTTRGTWLSRQTKNWKELWRSVSRVGDWLATRVTRQDFSCFIVADGRTMLCRFVLVFGSCVLLFLTSSRKFN